MPSRARSVVSVSDIGCSVMIECQANASAVLQSAKVTILDTSHLIKRTESAMDVGDLKMFEAVARLGGINRAAGELNTVQSNVTARIRLLEANLGAPLFQRHSRGVTLTVAGHRLLPYAARLRQLLVEARRAVADDGEP